MRTRTILREAYRRQAKNWPAREQETRDLPNGGYEVLTPTKGWKRVSEKRVRAQVFMANKFGFVR